MKHHTHIGCERGRWEPAALFFRARCTCDWHSDRYAEHDDAAERVATHRRQMQIEEGR